jgi:hypothetical protein
MVLTGDVVALLEQRGVRVRHYRFGSNREIAWTVTFDDDLIVVWIPLDVAADEVVDGVFLLPDDTVLDRLTDAPVDRARGALVLATAARDILTLPDFRGRLQLTATSPRGRRDLGEYIYDHTAPRP